MGNSASVAGCGTGTDARDAARFSANVTSESAADMATRATSHPDLSESDRTLFEAVTKETEQAVDYGLTPSSHFVPRPTTRSGLADDFVICADVVP
jgi:hypothetical protein